MSHIFNDNTEHLVVLAKNGDESALARLCSIYSERICRIVRLRMGKGLRSKMESMDIVQDTLISALRGLENFTYQNEGDFLRWVSTIAENRLRDNLDKLQADKRDVRKEIPLIDNRQTTQEGLMGAFEPSDLTTPSLIMSKREDLNRLEKAIDKLKPEHREVIILAKIEGLSYLEIGKKIGKSPDAVRMIMSRAMTELSGAFEEV